MMFGSEKLHDYFYQVDSEFVTPNRQQFDANGGYLGTEVSLGMSSPLLESMRSFLGGTVNFHQCAANEDSPLFEDDVTYTFGVGFVWRLYESDTKASW